MRMVPEISIVVCSPSDVQQEREIVRTVVGELERTIAIPAGVRVNLRLWEIDAFPGMHTDGPQGLIDPVLNIPEADIFIGILWKRIGTQTRSGLSGTEHEFATAVEAWRKKGSPRILFYFCTRPAGAKTREERDQEARVRKFKARFPKQGLSGKFQTTREFEKQIRIHAAQALHAVIADHAADKKQEQPASHKVMYVKLLHLSDMARTNPIYERSVERIANVRTPVYDEALYLHLSIYPQEQPRMNFSFRSTGVVDVRFIVPFIRKFLDDGPETAMIKNVFNPIVSEPSNVYFGLSHHINGLQRGHEDVGTRMDRAARHVRLLVDFTSVPGWRDWLASEPRAVHKTEGVERSVPVEEIAEGLFTSSITDAAVGDVLRMDLTVDWEKYNDARPSKAINWPESKVIPQLDQRRKKEL
jgi:hypothetical protein